MISIYRKINGVETEVCSVSKKGSSHKTAIMGIDEVPISIVVDTVLGIQEGDYIKIGDINYTLNRDAEFTKVSDVQYNYDLIFEHPIYILFDKLFVHRVSGLSNFILTGKLSDFVELLIWCVNKTTDNPLGIDTGWTKGNVIETEFRNIVFTDLSCREVLNVLANEFNAEYYLNNKEINFVDRIENATDLVFEQGKGKGLYSITQRNVDKEDTVTRIYPRGGNKNVPNEYADYEGYLVLPERYLENFTEHSKIVEKKVTFEDEFPHFLGKVKTASGADNTVLTCPEINFDVQQVAVGDNAHINFLTGDLMGVSFKFQWNNTLKQITLIKQDDETALADANGEKPQIPSSSKKAKVGDSFNFTGLFMPASYVEASRTRLRAKAQSYLDFYSRKRVKFELNVDHRFMRDKSELKVGDLVTINIPQKSISKLIRITTLDKNLDTGAISCTVSNYLDEKWEKKIENQISSLSSSVNSEAQNAVEKLVDIIQQYDSRVPSDRNLFSSLRVLKEIKDRAISKEINDIAAGLIKFTQGIEIGNFTTGALGGGGAFKMNNGVSELEVDKLTVRMIATFFELVISKLSHIGGQLILTPARMKCVKVEDGGSYYRCYFDRGANGEVANEFAVGDQARCQVFSGSGMKFYWRLVTSVGDDWINLSKTDKLGDSIPTVGDDIVQLGNRTNTERQSAQILSTVGSDAPSWKQYSGINSFSLEGKETTVFSSKGNKIVGSTVFMANGQDLTEWADETSSDIQDAQEAANEADRKAQLAIDNAEVIVADFNIGLAGVQAQLDNEITNWFYAHSPTLSNYPASDWVTNTEKDRHVNDTFTNIQQFVNNATTPDAGKSWKFIKDGNQYSWNLIADSDATKALLLVAQAQSTADGKSTTFLIQPTKYQVGDMWVLGADITLNSIAYKAGEILTATTTSATFNPAHWVKRVRYTDDTAVENLKIGGVNLLKKSANPDLLFGAYTGVTVTKTTGITVSEWGATNAVNFKTTGGTSGGGILRVYATYGVGVSGNSYSMSIFIRNNHPTKKIIFHSNQGGRSKNIEPLTQQKVVFENILSNGVGALQFQIRGDAAEDELDFDLWHPMIVLGNKISDGWSEAPEDVQARITQAQTDATNAQTSANSANTAVNNLNSYVDGAFKDGVIDTSEAKAIEKYINIINTEKANLEATYNKLYANTYLEGTAKTTLLNTKVSYFGAVDSLLNAINTAIADGKTTTTEKNAVDTQYNSYKSYLTSFQGAIEDANKAIQIKLEAISKEYVDGMQIGARNLIAKKFLRDWNLVNSSITQEGNDADGSYLGIKPDSLYSSIAATTNFNDIFQGKIKYKENTQYCFKIRWKLAGLMDYSGMHIRFYYSDGTFTAVVIPVNQTTIIEQSLITTAGKNLVKISSTYSAATVRTLIYDIQLTEGNKQTAGYIVAQEDIDAQINSYKYLADALQKSAIAGLPTEIQSGLLLSSLIALRNAQGQIRGGFVGLDDVNLSAWGGSTLVEALQNIAGWLLNKDGSGHLANGNIWWDILGQVVFGKEYADKSIVISPTATLPSLAEINNKEVYQLPHYTKYVSKNFSDPAEQGKESDMFVDNIQEFTLNNDGYLNIFASITYFWNQGLGDFNATGYITLEKLIDNNWVKLEESESWMVSATQLQITLNSSNYDLQRGKYRIAWYGRCSGGYETQSGGGNASVNVESTTLSYQLKIKKLVIASDGIAFYDSQSDNYFRLSLQDSTPLRYKGKTDMPGILATGQIGSGGSHYSYWGAKVDSKNATYTPTGIYDVYHKAGADYMVALQPIGDGLHAFLISQNNNQFRVQIRNNSGGAVAASFNYTISGNN